MKFGVFFIVSLSWSDLSFDIFLQFTPENSIFCEYRVYAVCLNATWKSFQVMVAFSKLLVLLR